MAGQVIFGVIAVVMGSLSIMFRGLSARASAAQNSVLLNGHLSGAGFQRSSRGVTIVVGTGFVILGVVLFVLGITHHTHH